VPQAFINSAPFFPRVEVIEEDRRAVPSESDTPRAKAASLLVFPEKWLATAMDDELDESEETDMGARGDREKPSRMLVPWHPPRWSQRSSADFQEAEADMGADHAEREAGKARPFVADGASGNETELNWLALRALAGDEAADVDSKAGLGVRTISERATSATERFGIGAQMRG
jgi:hypothetical protein